MRVLLICGILLMAAFAAGSAFGITEEIDQFFQDESDLQAIGRVRRSNKQKDGTDTPHVDNDKKKKTRRSCCGEHDNLKVGMGPGLKELQKECFDQAKKATEVTKKARMSEDYVGFIHGNKTTEEYICAVQCIGQKQELLDHIGNVNKDKMTEYVKKSYSSEPWKADIADKVLEKCYTVSQKPSEGEVSPDNGAVTNGRSVQAKCNSNGIAFIHCLWREMQLNCPADKIYESRRCNRLRERLRLRESGVKEGILRSLF